MRASQAKLEERATNAENELKRIQSSLYASLGDGIAHHSDPIVRMIPNQTGGHRLQVDFSTPPDTGAETLHYDPQHTRTANLTSMSHQHISPHSLSEEEHDQMANLSISLGQQQSNSVGQEDIHESHALGRDSPQVGINFILS